MDLPDVISTAVKQIMSDPARYGLAWNIRIGTMANDVGQVKLDGDTSPVSVSNMIGALKGSRVYILTIPGGTNYVIGRATQVGALVERLDPSANFTTTPVTIDTLLANVIAGCTYRIDTFEHLQSTANTCTVALRVLVDGVRRQQASCSLPVANATYGFHLSTIYHALTTKVATITIASFSELGGGTISSFGSTEYVNYVSIRDWP